MPNIGPLGSEVACSIIRMGGPPSQLIQQTLTWTLPGFDGHGFLHTGKVPGTFVARCLLLGLEAAVDAWFLNMQSLAGTVSVINDDWLKLHTPVVIHQVSAGLLKLKALGNGYDTIGTVDVLGVRIQ